MNVYLAVPIKSPLASRSRSVLRLPPGGTLDTRHSENKQQVSSNISSPAKGQIEISPLDGGLESKEM